MSQVEREQGHRATEGAGDGELLPALKDAGFLPENLDMEMMVLLNIETKRTLQKHLQYLKNIGDMSDDARWHSTKIGEVMQETSLRSDAVVENASKNNWPRDIPETLSQLVLLSEEVEEIIKWRMNGLDG